MVITMKRKVLTGLLTAAAVLAGMTSMPVSAETADISKEDISLLQDYLHRKASLTQEQFAAFDRNQDGCVNVFDLCLLKQNFLEQTGDVKNSGAFTDGTVWYVKPFLYKESARLDVVSTAMDDFRTLQEKNKAGLYQGNDISEINVSAVHIADYTFESTNNAQRVNFSEQTETIGKYAFMYCDLRSVNLPDSITDVGSWAFCSNYNLSSVVLSENMTSVPYMCFAGCNIRRMYIPESITFMHDSNFGNNCSPEIWYGGSEEQWQKICPATLHPAAVHYNAVKNIWL